MVASDQKSDTPPLADWALAPYRIHRSKLTNGV